MTFLSQFARLLVDPPGAIAVLRASRPLVQSLLTAAAATFLYQSVLSGLVSDIAGIIRLHGYDFGGFAILLSYLTRLPSLVTPVIFLLAIYVPASLLLLGAIHPYEGTTDILRREYRGAATVTLAVWALTLLVWLVPAAVFCDASSAYSRALWLILPVTSFLIPMTVTLASISESGYARAIAAVVVSGLSLVFLPFATWLALVLTSPVILIVTLFIFRGVYKNWAGERESRERMRQGLEAAAINPADATAHVDLGLLYLEQRDYERAAGHFSRAIEIDPDEVDAHFNLGKIARQRGALSEAIAHFDAVVQIDSEYSNAEVWREVGFTYYTAGQFEDAVAALEHFQTFRSWDAEGLYLLGLTYDALGRKELAREQMEAVVDAVKSAPYYKYRLERKWLRDAQAYLSTRK